MRHRRSTGPRACVRRLLLIGLSLPLAGCGEEGGGETPASAARAAERAVRDRIGGHLVTESYFAAPPPTPFGGAPPPSQAFGFGGPPPGMQPPSVPPRDAGDRYLAQRDRDDRFGAVPAEPRPTGDAVPQAELVEVGIGPETERPDGDVRCEFTAVQQLSEDLYRLRRASRLADAIGWDERQVRRARSDARRLPEPQRSEFGRRLSGIHGRRHWVLERVHAAGSRWPLSGRVEARRQADEADGWSCTVVRLRPEQRPSPSAHPRAAFPDGLLTADPDDDAAVADAWRGPYEAFVADVAAAKAQAEAADAERRERMAARIRELATLGSAWSTEFSGQVAGHPMTARMEFRLERPANPDDGQDETVLGTLTVTRQDGAESVLPVYFAPSRHESHDAEESGAPAGIDFFGPTFGVYADPVRTLPEPWNGFEADLVARPQDQAPTLLWLDRVLPMRRVD